MSMRQKLAEPLDALQLIPGIGGFAHGLAKPMSGYGRLPSGTTQGAVGLLGGALGAGFGQSLGARIHPAAGDIGSVIGAALGTGAGSAIARKMYERNVADAMSQQEILAMLRQMESGYNAAPADQRV
jgi:hypothetical protein